jgi:hypothetical protein
MRVLNPVHFARKFTLLVAARAVDAHLLHFESHPGRGIGSELVGQREVDDRALVELVALFCQHAALPEGARHIDLLAVVHWPLEQFELIHVELLLLLVKFFFPGPVIEFSVTCQAGRPVPTRNYYFTVPNSSSRGPSVTTLSS